MNRSVLQLAGRQSPLIISWLPAQPPRLFQGQQEPLSTASLKPQAAVFLSLPAIPRAASIFHACCAEKNPCGQPRLETARPAALLSLQPLDQVLVLGGRLPRIPLPSVIPWDFRFNEDDPPHLLGPYDYVRPQGCLDDQGKLLFSSQAHARLPR